MTIAELAALSKASLARIPTAYLFAAVVLLSSTAAFGLGVLEGREEGGAEGITVTTLGTTTPSFMPAAAEAAQPPAPAALPSGGEYVASKSGAKYYLPWCGGAKLIKDANKVWFASKADAEAAGYTPAANCKGL